jgi:hypothetical protein
MAQVHPVEITDSGNTAPVAGTQIVETADQFHATAIKRGIKQKSR